EGFWDYRDFHLNIYAAWVLKARVHLHAGNKTGAYAIASSLLNGTMPGGGGANFMTVFPSVRTLAENRRDPLAFTEVIFGMHDVDRSNVQRDNFSTDLLPENVLLTGQTRFRGLFPNIIDTRRAYFLDASNYSATDSLKAIIKYQRGQLTGADPYPYRYEMLPLITKAEVYLIAAETSDNDADKAGWLTLLRIERGYQQNNMDAFLTELDQVLQDEYERELYAGGQYVYFLKRNQKTSVPGQTGGNVALSDGKLTLPVPDAEDYNRQ
ncbi:MAG: hypothetical protein LBK12_07520, partial [Odoribacteraceae bacterium]|nr:hypothetical protein [Odoribacteraceae bacterium]